MPILGLGLLGLVFLGPARGGCGSDSPSQSGSQAADQVDTAPQTNPDNDSSSLSNTESCELTLSGAGIGWIFCLVLNATSDSLDFFERQVKGLLRVGPADYGGCTPQSNQLSGGCVYKAAWVNVRNLATFAIVITALVMIISNALDFGIFSQYTIKKYLPRLVIGTILIQLSWALGDLSLQFINNFGDFIEFLIRQPFGNELDGFGLHNIVSSELGAGATVATGLTIWASGGVGPAGVGLLLVSALFAFLMGFLFVVLRKYLLIILLIFSPLGLALWILPGNDNGWKFYRKTFFTLALMYPALVAVLTFGKVFAYIILNG